MYILKKWETYKNNNSDDKVTMGSLKPCSNITIIPHYTKHKKIKGDQKLNPDTRANGK